MSSPVAAPVHSSCGGRKTQQHSQGLAHPSSSLGHISTLRLCPFFISCTCSRKKMKPGFKRALCPNQQHFKKAFPYFKLLLRSTLSSGLYNGHMLFETIKIVFRSHCQQLEPGRQNHRAKPDPTSKVSSGRKCVHTFNKPNSSLYPLGIYAYLKLSFTGPQIFW